MRRRLFGLVLVVALGACGQVRAPLLPLGGETGAFSPSITPHHYHVIAFLNFKGGGGGAQPVPGLIGDTSDNLYGVTGSGGDLACSTGKGNGCGVVYQLVHVSGLQFDERVLHAFGGADGAFPDSPLAGGNGIFYGATSSGGQKNLGTIFAVTAKTGHVQTLYSFQGGNDGAFPIGRLYVDAKGDLFGTTAFGGRSGCLQPSQGTGCGTVFVLKPIGGSRLHFTESILHRFAPGADGWEPWAGVVPFNGKLVGTTIYGGKSACNEGCGTVFELSPSGASKRTVYAFGGGKEGAYVKSPLYVDSTGNLYGEAQNGGDDTCRISHADAHGCGTIFEVSSSGKLTVLHRFGGSDGAQPYTGLTEFSGTLYGSTTYGGDGGVCSANAPGCGVLFAVSKATGFKVIEAFKRAGSALNDVNPSVFLCAITNELNGTTSSGGKYGYGTIFKLVP